MDKPEVKALQRAVELAGGQTELARRLTEVLDDPRKTVKQAHVWNWLNRDKQTPAEYARLIEGIVEGQVTRYALRPDVFGPAPNRGAAA